MKEHRKHVYECMFKKVYVCLYKITKINRRERDNIKYVDQIVSLLMFNIKVLGYFLNIF